MAHIRWEALTSNARCRDSNAEGGFTLIELMLVMVVLGILAGIVILGIGPFQQAATTSVSNANNKQCETAQSAYKAAAAPKPLFGSFFDGGTAPAGCTTP